MHKDGRGSIETKSSGYKLQERGYHLDIRKKLLTVRAVQQLNKTHGGFFFIGDLQKVAQLAPAVEALR